MHVARAVLAAVAVAASPGLSAAPCAGFSDVSDSDAFCIYVDWMKNRGITSGTSPTTYAPEAPVTRLQMAAFMYRLGFQNAFLQGGNAFGAPAVLGTADGQLLDIRVHGQRVMRYSPGAVAPNVIGGGGANVVSAGVRGAAIGGGGLHAGAADPDYGPAGGNAVSDHYGTVAGGLFNQAGDGLASVTDDAFATVGGGTNNWATNLGSTIAGGEQNRANGAYGVVAGGQQNSASGGWSSIVGGANNVSSGVDSTVAGGYGNRATGSRAFAAGYLANAQHGGCFVWSDAYVQSATSCNAPNEFIARAVGGFYFWTSGFSDATYAGARLASGTGAWAAYSDRNGKHEVRPVDAGDILDRVVGLPIATWQWKAEAGDVRHMGPMAQDFRASFGLGSRDTEIVSVDADGVALAAIQGLNAKLEDRLAAKDAEIASLRAELAELQSLRTEVAAIRAALALPTAVADEGRPQR